MEALKEPEASRTIQEDLRGFSMNERARSYRELDAWKEAIDLVMACYGLMRGFPPEERFCLGAQISRAAISIPSNIAEGQSRSSAKEFLHHISFAYGSLAELETQLEIAERLGYIGDQEVYASIRKSCNRIGAMLSGLRRYLGSADKGSGR